MSLAGMKPLEKSKIACKEEVNDDKDWAQYVYLSCMGLPVNVHSNMSW